MNRITRYGAVAGWTVFLAAFHISALAPERMWFAVIPDLFRHLASPLGAGEEAQPRIKPGATGRFHPSAAQRSSSVWAMAYGGGG